MSAIDKLKQWWKDPFRIERDWKDFQGMTDEQLEKHWDHLLCNQAPSRRFRRLSYYLALRWVGERMARR